MHSWSHKGAATPAFSALKGRQRPTLSVAPALPDMLALKGARRQYRAWVALSRTTMGRLRATHAHPATSVATTPLSPPWRVGLGFTALMQALPRSLARSPQLVLWLRPAAKRSARSALLGATATQKARPSLQDCVRKAFTAPKAAALLRPRRVPADPSAHRAMTRPSLARWVHLATQHTYPTYRSAHRARLARTAEP